MQDRGLEDERTRGGNTPGMNTRTDHKEEESSGGSPQEENQDWQQDGAETACWSEPQRGRPGDQPLPSGAEGACRVACGQPPSSVSLASLETRLDTLRTGREQLFEKLP